MICGIASAERIVRCEMDGTDDVAREAHGHRPVMVERVLHHLFAEGPDGAPATRGGTIGDLTIGLGGHAEAILRADPACRVIGVDRDPRNLEVAARRLAGFGDRVKLCRAKFDDLDAQCRALGVAVLDGVLLDLGVSSTQLDEPERGFSFDLDGPLDMRMDPDQPYAAADLVNRGRREELLHAVGTLGDEKRAGRVVAAILEARERAPLRRTCELADVVLRALGGRSPAGRHPATRTFQGLRMAVNDELAILERALPRRIERLAPRGRMVVIAFHGGEDRLVKTAFREAARRGAVIERTRRPEWPADQETRNNPRARSARLRAVERTARREAAAPAVASN